MPKHVTWRSGDSVIHRELRENFYWIEDFLKCESLHKKIEAKKRELDEVRVAARSLECTKKAFIESLTRFVNERQKESLKSYIFKYARHPDPASDLRGLPPDDSLRVFALFPDDMLETVFDELAEIWPKDSITDAERKKRRAGLERDIKKYQTEIAKYSEYPVWREFVNEWRALNSKLSEGCDPQNFPINAEKRPGELEAFKALGLGRFVNKDSQFMPAEP
jgi:hypothetical protein